MSDINNLPMQEYSGTNIVQIRPIETIKNNFNGICTFQVNISQDELILAQSIYLAGKVSLAAATTTDNLPPVGITTFSLPLGRSPGKLGDISTVKAIGCISSGGLDNLFSKCSHEIAGLSGSSVIQSIDNYQQTCSLLRASHEYPLTACKQYRDPFMLKGSRQFTGGDIFIDDTHTDAIFTSTQSVSETAVEYVLKNAIKQGLDREYEVSLASRLPLSLFMNENKLYQGNHIIRLTIDNDYKRKFVNVFNTQVGNAEVKGLGTITSFNGTYGDTATTANSVAVVIQDLYLYCEYVKINPPMGRPMGKHLYVFESWNTTTHACAAASSDNFILPCKPNLLKIIMGFRTPNTLLSNGTYATALINPEMAPGFNSDSININKLFIRYLSDVYPQSDYSLLLPDSCVAAVTDVINAFYTRAPFGTAQYDTVRAYEDYYLNCEFDNPNHAMTYDEWRRNPIFVFKFCNTSNISSNVEINITCGSSIPGVTTANIDLTTPANVNTPNALGGATLYLLYVYRTVMEADFGENTVDYKVFNVA